MTQDQFSRYQKLKEEVDNVKSFLLWCGDRYHGRKRYGTSKYRISIRTRLKNFVLYRQWHACSVEENTYDIPTDLQGRIIEVIEQWVDEKEQELSKI